MRVKNSDGTYIVPNLLNVGMILIDCGFLMSFQIFLYRVYQRHKNMDIH